MITNSRYSTHETLTKKKGYSSKIFSMAAFGVGSKDLSTLMLLPCVTRFHDFTAFLSLTVASSLLTVLQILSGFFTKLLVF